MAGRVCLVESEWRGQGGIRKGSFRHENVRLGSWLVLNRLPDRDREAEVGCSVESNGGCDCTGRVGALVTLKVGGWETLGLSRHKWRFMIARYRGVNIQDVS